MLYGNYIISVGVLSMMGYQVEAAFFCGIPHHIYNQITEGLPACGEVFGDFYTVVPTYKILRAVLCLYDLPCPGCKISLSLFAIQCPPYSVFKVQCRTEAAKISAYIYHLSLYRVPLLPFQLRQYIRRDTVNQPL